MILTWDRDASDLEVGGEHFIVTNRVRNEIDPGAVRRLHDPSEVRRCIVNGQWGPPYMPRKFPKGECRVTDIEIITDRSSDFWPVKIKTNAHQLVQIWELDANGGYDHPIDKLIDDSGYHLHWCEKSISTLGCGRVGTNDDTQVRALAHIIRGAMALHEVVHLKVV